MAAPKPAIKGAGAVPAGAAAAAAGQAASAGAMDLGATLAGWWTALTTQHVPAVQAQAHQAVKHLQKQSFVMPVDVRVDFLKPTWQALEEGTMAVWTQLPPPVQQAAPFVGVGLGTGLVVFAVQQRRLNKQRQRGQQLEQQVATLKKEKADLISRINALKIKAGTPRTEVEARMAAAVAEATNAAAAAADAAARAATACIIQRLPPQPAGAGSGLPPGALHP